MIPNAEMSAPKQKYETIIPQYIIPASLAGKINIENLWWANTTVQCVSEIYILNRTKIMQRNNYIYNKYR